MSDHVHRPSEIVGTSTTGVDDAIRTAVAKAPETVRNIEWSHPSEIRDQVTDGTVEHVQVPLTIGFRVD